MYICSIRISSILVVFLCFSFYFALLCFKLYSSLTRFISVLLHLNQLLRIDLIKIHVFPLKWHNFVVLIFVTSWWIVLDYLLSYELLDENDVDRFTFHFVCVLFFSFRWSKIGVYYLNMFLFLLNLFIIHYIFFLYIPIIEKSCLTPFIKY